MMSTVNVAIPTRMLNEVLNETPRTTTVSYYICAFEDINSNFILYRSQNLFINVTSHVI